MSGYQPVAQTDAIPPPAYTLDGESNSPQGHAPAIAQPYSSAPHPSGYNQPSYAPPPPQPQPQYSSYPPQQGYQYQAPPQGYYPANQPPGSVVVVRPPPVMAVFTHRPTYCKCSHCGFEGVTSVSHEANGCTWVACFGLFLFTGICCCIPFCVDSCQSAVHKCSVCGYIVAVVQN
eukprot:TRINITY_DN3450_c0_g1_i1.p1 TRINITY_DN3450_c0_g1~~TRINITY_DN3450_c0_g1_i1.p1  ORF type:complete len:175 (-),score=25.18 TRINITY_DN3450_c0_g1_i1:69-593(-)